MSIKKHIPNAITCCNLLCGCLAIVQAFEGNLVWAAYLVGLAAVFDFFDGFAARLLRVTSPIGKDLDSLADMVTFGVVPGIVMFKLIRQSLFIFGPPGECAIQLSNHGSANPSFPLTYQILMNSAFIIPVFSAIRLAKFNNDTRQTTSFIGMPTPANAIFICSLVLINDYFETQYLISRDAGLIKMVPMSDFFYTYIFNRYTLSILSVVLSFLLVSEIPLFALKFKFFGWKGNRTKYVFLALSLLLLATLQFVGIPLIIILYVLISLITNAWLKRKAV